MEASACFDPDVQWVSYTCGSVSSPSILNQGSGALGRYRTILTRLRSRMFLLRLRLLPLVSQSLKLLFILHTGT